MTLHLQNYPDCECKICFIEKLNRKWIPLSRELRKEVNLPAKEIDIQSNLNNHPKIGQLRLNEDFIEAWDGEICKSIAGPDIGLDNTEKEKECLTDPIISSVHAARMNIPLDLLLMPKTKRSTPVSTSIIGNHGGNDHGLLLNTCSGIHPNMDTGTVRSYIKNKLNN